MSNPNRSVSVVTRNHNRIAALMAHSSRYSFRGVSRLAADAGVSKSAISKLVRGLTNPLYTTVAPIVKCLEEALGRRLEMREVLSAGLSYPTKFVCDVVDCPGCLPDLAYEADGSRKPRFKHVLSGRWTGDVGEFNGTAHEENK